MTKEQKSILTALFIGDGHIRKAEGMTAQIEIGHSIKQKEYLEYKANLLHNILGGKKPIIKQRTSNMGTETVRFVKTHKYFRILRKWLYKSGKKVITRNILNKLTPHGLAIWYMDDGWLAIRKNPATGNPRSRHIGLGTYGFTYEEHLIMQKYFEEVCGVRFSIIKYKDKFKLVAGAKEGKKFIDIIEPYILPMFNYKIDFKYSTRARNTELGDDIV